MVGQRKRGKKLRIRNNIKKLNEVFLDYGNAEVNEVGEEVKLSKMTKYEV
jgi:hypothetical protein